MGEHLKPAAIGFSSHSGWAAAVCLGSPGSASCVIERSRLLLTSWPLPREPYHDAKRSGPDQAEGIVSAAADEARVLAAEAITGLAASLRGRGYELVASGVVLGSGKPGTSLSKGLSTHAAMHGAEGWLFREALIDASHNCGLTAVGVPESALPARLAAALGKPEGDVSAFVQELGRVHGPPWGRDQKAATTAALVALHSAFSGTPA
ncbi:MAG: hypothetical protein E6J43_11880 [Chloroflexi bacterium]|nr:MAG: hypothetical protein E6J43_11880 [Chloroflexota bacterium]